MMMIYFLLIFRLFFCYRHDEGINVTERQESSQNHHHSRTSNNNIRSPESNIRIGGTYRKKKPAPLPPTKKESCLSDQPSMSKVECNFKNTYIYIIFVLFDRRVKNDPSSLNLL